MVDSFRPLGYNQRDFLPQRGGGGMKTEEMYASMRPWRLFFKVALPGMISMFAMSVYSIIEGIFIGQRLGESAFAAVNIAFPIIMINFSLSDLIGVGSSVPISIALGRKDEKSAFQPIIRGEEIMQIFNLPPCHAVGILKSALKEARWNEEIEPTYEAELAFLKTKAQEIEMP
jgi:O-antigen/teichoic acid export membrane protein